MLAPTERLMGEIAKCDVVCANCHRLRTQSRPTHRPTPKLAASLALERKRRYWRAQARTCLRLSLNETNLSYPTNR